MNNTKEIKEALLNAQESDRPFPVLDDESKLSVVGDANKTEPNNNDYEITYKMPIDMLPDIEGEIIDNNKIFKIKYKDVIITPRKQPKLTRHILKMMPFYYSTKDASELSDEDILQLDELYGDDVCDAIYDFVATAIGIDKSLIEYADYNSILENFIKLCVNNPESINEPDMVFGHGATEEIKK